MAEGRRLSPRSGIFDGIHTLTPQTIVYVGSDGEVIPLNLGNGLSISNNTLNVTGNGTIDANAINVGTGVGLYKQKVDSDLHFKTLVGNSKMVIDLVGQDEVRLNVVNVADQVHTHSITDVLNLQSSLDAKVDVVAGKGLSTNDFSHVYRDLVDMMDQYMEETGSGLHVSGGEITLTGGIGFNISAGVGYALTPLGELVRVTWPLISSTCQNDGDNYMTIDYQGNLVQYSSTAGHENIRLGYVRTGANNSVVVGFSNVKFTGAHHLYNINQWASTLLGSLVDDGCNLALKPSPNNLEVTVASGRVWAQFNKYDINDTDTFTKIFNTAIGYVPDNASTPNQIVLGVYNNSSAAPASALVPMTPGYYKKDMFFITVEGTLFYVYGTAEYSTLEAAKAAPVPAAPDNIKNQIVRVGAVVSQEGATEIAELQDIRPIFARLFDVGFAASNATVIDHGDLVGLGDDDHVLYHTDVRGDVRYYRKDQIDLMLDDKEDSISAGTTAQYYRGDKTFQDLTKSSVGLGNVDNTSDANKPISTATQSALDVKQPLDSNLTDIAALLAVNDDIIQRKAGVWTNRTPVQLKADLSLTKTDVGLGNVDNTSDVNKPISTATQTALNGKQPLDQSLTELSALTPTNDDVFQYKAGAWTNRTPVQLKADLSLSKTDVGLGNVDNTSDVNKPISTATQTALDGKENTISVGTTAQYYRGDKTFQDLTKSSVGLNNVDNTSDVNKPISAATQTALDNKADQSDVDLLTTLSSEQQSSGLISGASITLTGGIGFSISAGVGYIHHATLPYKRLTWGALSGSTIYDGDNFIAIDYAGSLYITSTLDTSGYSIPVAYIRTANSNSVIVGYASSKLYQISSFPQRVADFSRRALGSIVASGLNIAEQASPNFKKVTLTSGSMFVNLEEKTFSDTSTFTKLFDTSDYGMIVDNTSLNEVNTDYYNVTTNVAASALVEMTAGYWKKDVFFLTPSGSLFYVYGQSQFATEQEAKAAPIPTIPETIIRGVAFIATIVCQKGSSSIASAITDIRPIMSRIFETGSSAIPSTIVNHGDLTGLAIDDHPQYHTDVRGDVRYYRKTEVDGLLSNKQNESADLTSISSLTPTNDDIIQRKAGVWTNRSVVEFKSDLALTQSDVGLGNVDNTSDINKPISTATQTALDGKQATLVSGTNIKTINGTTLIGSGNLTVSATPAGSSTHIQFNSGGTLAGSPDFTWDDTTKSLSLLGADTEILMQGITNEPAAAPAGALRLYTKSIAGRMLPKWVGPSGVDTPMQANIGFNRAVWVIPNTTTSVTAMGIAVTNTGTLATPTLTSTNTLSSVKRTTFTTAATAGSLAGTRSAADVWRGNAEGRGGFFITIRFGVSALQAGNRAFLGLETTAAAPTNIDPLTSTTNGRIGVGINANTGNWNLVHNVAGTAPTVVNLGANFPVNTTDLYELALFAAPNGSAVGYRVKNLSTGGETSGTIATNIPSSTTFMAIQMWITNNATAAAAGLAMSKIYLETDL